MKETTPSAGVEQRRTNHVVIIGAGLIGASIGCALSAAGYVVHLRDHKISHARVAAGLGAGTVDPPVSADVVLVVIAASAKEWYLVVAGRKAPRVQEAPFVQSQLTPSVAP